MFCGDNNDFSEFLSYIQMVKGKNAKFLKLILLIVNQSSAAGCLERKKIINNQSKELKVTYTLKECLFYFSKKAIFAGADTLMSIYAMSNMETRLYFSIERSPTLSPSLFQTTKARLWIYYTGNLLQS